MHESGSEYWLQYGLFPSKKSVVYIDTNTNDGTYAIEGTLKYITEEKVPRKNFKCDPDATIESYTQCAFNELQDYECSSAINKIGKYFNETNICKNHTQLLDNYYLIGGTRGHLTHTLFSPLSPTKCVRPCKTSGFDVSLKKDHENTKVMGRPRLRNLVKDGMFLLNFRYGEFLIENKKEYFVMNEDGLISAVGGFLGLFLGSSLVSVIEWIGQLFKKCSK